MLDWYGDDGSWIVPGAEAWARVGNQGWSACQVLAVRDAGRIEVVFVKRRQRYRVGRPQKGERPADRLAPRTGMKRIPAERGYVAHGVPFTRFGWKKAPPAVPVQLELSASPEPPLRPPASFPR